MPAFGKTSKEKLETCDPRLQEIFNEVIKHYDCTVLQGVRLKEEQNEYFRTGKSKVQWPNSKHNVLNPGDKSRAVDVVPYFKTAPNIRWEDKEAFYFFGGVVMAIAATKGIKLRWGGNWDGDDEFKDQTFMDLPHFELVD